MKSRFFILALAALFCLAGCKKAPVDNEPELPVNFTNTAGDWKLVEWNGNSMSDGKEPGVFIHLKGGEFVMWQSVGSMYPAKYTGTYNILEEEGVGMIIRGMYEYTYEYWQHKYVITSLKSRKMVWTALDDPSDVSVYERTDDFPKE